MNSDRRNWSTAAMGRQALVADQVVLGHLLPRYQAAQDWQQTVQAELALQGSVSGGKRSIQIGIVSLLRDTVRRWRSRLRVLPVRLAMLTLERPPCSLRILLRPSLVRDSPASPIPAVERASVSPSHAARGGIDAAPSYSGYMDPYRL
jgi:hypothetical protein